MALVYLILFIIRFLLYLSYGQREEKKGKAYTTIRENEGEEMNEGESVRARKIVGGV